MSLRPPFIGGGPGPGAGAEVGDGGDGTGGDGDFLDLALNGKTDKLRVFLNDRYEP